MRRPTRTRRLSIAAMVSLLAFAVVAGAGAESLRAFHGWQFKSWRGIGVVSGRIGYWHWYGTWLSDVTELSGYESTKAIGDGPLINWKFNMGNEQVRSSQSGDLSHFELWIPLWFPLLLLLIAPARWLIAQPANAPAFPVIPDAKQT